MTELKIGFILELLPIPWKSVQQGKGYWYSPLHKQNKIAEEEIRSVYQSPLITDPIDVHLIFFMPRPKASKKRTQDMIEGRIRPQYHGDRTNIGKWIEDRMQNIVYVNDKQIVGGWVGKYYTDRPDNTPYIFVSISNPSLHNEAIERLHSYPIFPSWRSL